MDGVPRQTMLREAGALDIFFQTRYALHLIHPLEPSETEPENTPYHLHMRP